MAERLAGVVVALACCAFLFGALQQELVVHHGVLLDDAYISLRHAQMFAEGHGFNYNAGERVEGYTNFLYTAIMSIPFFVNADPIVWIKVVGICSGIALLWSTFQLARPLIGPIAAAIVCLGLGVDPRLSVVSTWGLETVFFSMLCVVGLSLLFNGRTKSAAVVFALASMTRMDGALFFLAAAAYLCAAELLLVRPRRFRTLLEFGGCYAVVFGTYFVTRWIYYGFVFPNTYYAKLGTVANSYERGIAYVSTALDSMGVRQPVLVGVLFGSSSLLLAAMLGGRRLRAALDTIALRKMAIVAAAALYVFYIVRVGGDHFQERFIYHAIPLLFLSVVLLYDAPLGILKALDVRWLSADTLRRIRAPATCGSAFVLGVALFTTPHHFVPGRGVAGWASMGEYLHDKAPRTAVLATDAAGALPYYAGLETIDMLGLCDIHTAHLMVTDLGKGVAGHEKCDPQYILSRRPDFIATWVDDDGRAGRGLANYLEFDTSYELAALVDMDTWEISKSRVFQLSRGMSYRQAQSEIESMRNSAGGYHWGLFVRRNGPRTIHRDFSATSFFSRVQGALGRDGNVVEVKRGHEKTHILYGPFIHLPRGKYSGEMVIRAANVDPTAAEVCSLDVWEGHAIQIERHLRPIDVGEDERTVTFGFSVEDAQRDHPYEFRLWCWGSADVTVRSVALSGTLR